MSRTVSEVLSQLVVGDDGIVINRHAEVAIGGVLLVENHDGEILVIRKAPRPSYEFSGLWALPGGLARSEKINQPIQAHELSDILARSLAHRARAEAGWPGHHNAIRRAESIAPRLTEYTAKGKERHAIVIPFLPRTLEQFEPVTTDRSVTAARWALGAELAGELTPASCLILAEHLWSGFSDATRRVWLNALERATAVCERAAAKVDIEKDACGSHPWRSAGIGRS